VSLIYRRLALLTGARASIEMLARGWECIISGYIGANQYKVGEYYRTRKEARSRQVQINWDRRALVVSVEEVLYPLALIVAKFDTTTAPGEPPVADPPYTSNPDQATPVWEMYPDNLPRPPTRRSRIH
jgi:hypothetical protein